LLAGGGAAPLLGAVLLAYAAWGLAGLKPALPPRAERIAGPLVGLATGLVTAATGVFVMPAVPYLQALGLTRAQLMQAMGLSFTVSTLALWLALYAGGQLGVGDLGLSLALVLPALLGMAAGQALLRLLSPRVFRLCFFGGLALLGLHMVLRGG
ncbi:MAG: sulfite exporter TauE/SafE family protein, partial [Solimonas sp.]